jgi:NAD(P)-dependent dehydrogenase (short-subunit alcohol dehydrogenase family)
LFGFEIKFFQETKKLLLKAGATDAKILLVTADVTIEEDTKKIVAETVNKFGKLDVLVRPVFLLSLCTVFLRENEP